MVARTWTIRVLVVGVLAATAALGANAGREVDVRSVRLDAIPENTGEWVYAELQRSEVDPRGTSVKQHRLYQNAAGQNIQASLVATATRLGALRDYSVALEAQGWTRGNREILGGPTIGSLGRPMGYRLEQLHHGKRDRLALTWFVSARRQAHDLPGAETKGWLDLILRSHPPLWVELYAAIDVDGDAEDERASLIAFAETLGPVLAELAQQESGRLAASRTEAQ